MIGLMGALEEEVKLILENVAVEETVEGLRRTFYRGMLAGYQVAVAHSGVGKVRAAARAQFLIDRFGIDRLIFVGVAGAINPELKVGDIVIAQRALEHDYEVLGRRSHWYEADKGLVELARGAAAKLGHPIRLGSVLTGDQAISSTSRKQELWQAFGGDCVEMEGAAVAHVCWINNIPFVLIRGISDLAEETSIDQFRQSFAEVAAWPARMAVEMLRGLPLSTGR